MICQLCGKRNATVCINIDPNGVKTQQYICEVCAEERKLKENPSGEAILRLVNDIKKENAKRIAEVQESLPDITCPECSTTYKDFIKTGLLGCQNCYSSFSEHLDPLLSQITKHPKPLSEPETEQSDERNHILKLKLKLKQCIDAEDYEQAAIIRDEINKLTASQDQKEVEQE